LRSLNTKKEKKIVIVFAHKEEGAEAVKRAVARPRF
jgi:hypothetical protein